MNEVVWGGSKGQAHALDGEGLQDLRVVALHGFLDELGGGKGGVARLLPHLVDHLLVGTGHPQLKRERGRQGKKRERGSKK